MSKDDPSTTSVPTREPPADVAGLLRRFRLRAGLTQEALAEASGLSVAAIRTIEGRRRRAARPETIQALASALGLQDGDRHLLELAARQAAAQQAAVANRNAVPRELPPAVADFTGRTQQLDDLLRLLRDPYVVAPSIVISAVSGMGGVGKTTLALQAGWLTSEDFPDGQLYINLRGGTDRPLNPAEALRQLFQALGIRIAGETDDTAALSARYRTALSGRRALIVLDDAATTDQLLPLLPGAPGVAVVVTTRQHLTDLPGVQHLNLEVLSDDEAVRLLGEVVGRQVIAADLESAQLVVERCGNLPLAIRIAGGQCRQTPTGLRELAALLADESVAALSEVHRSIGLSLTALAAGNDLDRAVAEAFPLLTLFDGDHFPHRAAARVLDTPLPTAADILERLVDANLVQTPAPRIYKFHDLVRDTGRSMIELADTELREIRLRELRCYTGMLWRYGELGMRMDPFQAFGDPPWSADAAELSDQSQILNWLETELPNLVRLIQSAVDGGDDEQSASVRLALGMPHLAGRLGRFAEASSALMAIATSSREMDLRHQWGIDYWAGHLRAALGYNTEAVDWFRAALDSARRLGEPYQLAASLLDLSHVLCRSGGLAEAASLNEEARSAVGESGLDWLVTARKLAMGSVAGALGDLDRQWKIFSQALAAIPAQYSSSTAVMHFETIGASLVESGQWRRASKVLADGLALSRADGIVAAEAGLLYALGRSYAGACDWERAAEAFADGAVVAARFPEEQKEARLLHQLGCVRDRLGAEDGAREAWERALVLYERVADPKAEEVRVLLAQLLGSG